MKFLVMRLALVCSCLVLSSLSFDAAAETLGYQLSVERPEKYGNYYSFKSQVFQSTHTTESRNGKPHSEEKNTIEASIVGTAWFSDVGEKGEIGEVVIYPNEYTGKLNGKEVPLTIDERLFVQMRDGELKVYSSAGHSKSPEVVQVLGALLAFMVQPDESELSKDSMLALDKPRKPGQSWKGDNKALITSLNKTWDLQAQPDHADSALSFSKVSKLFEEDAAELQLDIKLKHFTIPALTKRGLSVDKSTGSVSVKRVLPIKKASRNGKVSKQVNLSVTASADVPGQGKVEVKVVTKLKSQAEYQINE